MDRNHKPLLCVMFVILYRLHDLSWPFFHSESFFWVARFLFHPNWRMQSIIGNMLESILLRGHRLCCVMFGILHDISWPFFTQTETINLCCVMFGILYRLQDLSARAAQENFMCN